ncbi:taste receptor type 2 member 4 [Dromiciops gliroides]|uniref:taste receptor type 2 member 4 n=1 Tax=Dromiciops gliroides TaxID=33562 RepID=UPI001CC434CA|nr:taste receptor type 2 member 4 [Dromiciops gliroides]
MLLPISFFFRIFFIIFSLIQLLTGIVGNLLILAVNCRTWIKSKNLSSFDTILSSLAITRCICLCIMFLYLVFSLIFLESECPVLIYAMILNSWIVLDSCSLWIVTLLNIFYCVKIANFNHSLFLWLKRNLSLKMPWLLLACLLVPVFSHFLSILLSKIPSSIDSTQENARNSTNISSRGSIFLIVASVVLSFSLQFVINLVSCSLLISSLRRHMQEMQRNANSFWNPQTEAHVGAMKAMIFFLILYVPYSIARMIIFLPSTGIRNYWINGILLVVNCTYSPGHTIFIILLHPKLKARIKNILWCN